VFFQRAVRLSLATFIADAARSHASGNLRGPTSIGETSTIENWRAVADWCFTQFLRIPVLPLAQVYAILFATPLLHNRLVDPDLGREKVRIPPLGRRQSLPESAFVIVLRPGETEITLASASGHWMCRLWRASDILSS